MDFPKTVLQALNYEQPAKPTEPNKTWNTDQYNKSEDTCPVGCNPARTTLAISKSGRKDKGRFVTVFYRESKLKPEQTLEQKQKKFWAEVEQIEARTKLRESNSLAR